MRLQQVRNASLHIAIGVSTVLTLCVLTWITPLLAQHSPAGHGQPDQAPASAAPAGKNANVLTVSPERLQSIGVKFELAKRQPVDKVIRTVGLVEIDERRLAHVNIKLEGWIDELFVNSTGEQVKKGQILFTVYSPELVATQTEYLLAVKSHRTLGESAFPEVADGAKALLAAARRRLRLWDITEDHLEDLERTGEVLRTLPIHAPASGTVKLGVRAGDWVEVVEGLKEDEHVVTSANFLLDSESQLKAAVGGMQGMKH